MEKNTNEKSIVIQKSERGFAMMLAIIFFIVISVIVVLGLTGPSAREYRVANDAILSKQSYFLAESGVEDSYYRLKNNYHVSSSETMVLAGSSETTAMTFLGGGAVDIAGLGNVNSRERSVDVKISGQTRKVFSYAAQSGAGGIDLAASGATISGDAYSNGPITGIAGSTINGSAVSGGVSGSTDNQFSGSGTPEYDVSFGNASASEQILQSFKVTQSAPLDKISLYIKKVGSPSDATVTIYRNNSTNVPDLTPIASSTLAASDVDTSYGWVDVVFAEKQTLSVGQIYWFVVRPSISSSDYYTIGTNLGGYINGVGKIGQYGNTPVDPISANSEYYFQLFLGGVDGLIQGGSGGGMNIGLSDSNTVRADSVGAVNSHGTIYCTNDLGSNTLIAGTASATSCITDTVPATVGYPVSDSDIAGWEADAAAGTNIGGNVSYTSSFGSTISTPEKINGNLSVSAGVLTIKGTIFVTGDLTVSGSGKIRLDASTYGANSGVFVVNGRITFSGSGYLQGSGTSGSNILLVSKSNSISITTPAISISGGGGTSSNTAVFYAPYGLVSFSGGTITIGQASGYKLKISNGSTIAYNTGLVSVNVLSGSTASPTYDISSWNESQ